MGRLSIATQLDVGTKRLENYQNRGKKMSKKDTINANVLVLGNDELDAVETRVMPGDVVVHLPTKEVLTLEGADDNHTLCMSFATLKTGESFLVGIQGKMLPKGQFVKLIDNIGDIKS